MENIILIGMPGVGKSTIGVILAKVKGYQFVDSDLMIQKEENRLLSEIIKEDGIDGFLEIENRVNKSIEVEKSIIATGGSAVYGTEAMKHLAAIGTIVYLKVSLKTLEHRLGDLQNRGVVLREGQDLTSLYEERTKLYEFYADVVIDEENKTIEQTLQTILEVLK